MESRKVLFVSQEIAPFVGSSTIADMARNLPQGIQESGKEIRTFMPRYGCINERRNQLHEVIRLSGMNIIINDTDHPLIIKVASIQSARMQIYFIDNEEFFSRKFMTIDADGNQFPDNDERMFFFARGVLETVKKLRWVPDIIHCFGWFPSMLPVVIRNIYDDDPMFKDSKIVYSVYKNPFDKSFGTAFASKIPLTIDCEEFRQLLANPNMLNLSKTAIKYSDAVVYGDSTINDELDSYIAASGKPTLDYCDNDEYVNRYNAFYDSLF